MRKRVLVFGALAAGVFAVAGQGVASANVTWCLSDPPVEVVTPGGQYLTVNNMVYLSVLDRSRASLITDDATAVADGAGGTLITVHVYIPSSVHGAFTVSSDNRYKVSTSGGATGGTVITLHLDVPIS
jgi:hypothetical protein